MVASENYADQTTLVDDGSPIDPPALRAENERPPMTAGSVLRSDRIAPPATLLQAPSPSQGTDPIPASRYFSQAYALLEKEKLWPKVWQMACWGGDIPNAGDIHVYRILDRSVLIIRQRDRSVKAFVNACLHRGRELCEEHTHQGELKCPYHFFTWGLDGGLKWTPSKWDFPQINETGFRLPEVRLEEWNGFYFINFNIDAPSLKSYLGPRFLDDWSIWDFSNRYKAIHVEKRIQCNWKTGIDAFIEAFHSFASHGQGAGVSPDDCAQVDVFPDSPHINRFVSLLGYPSPRLDPQPAPEATFEALCAGFMPELLGTPEGRLQPGEDSRAGVDRIARAAFQNRFGIDVTDVSTTEILDAISYFVFPNFMPWSCLSYPLVYRFRPTDDPDWCIWDTMLFHPYHGERPPSCQTVILGPDDPMEDIDALGGLALVLHQDALQLPAVQRGMKNLSNGELVITQYQEQRIRHYHQTLTTYLGA